MTLSEYTKDRLIKYLKESPACIEYRMYGLLQPTLQHKTEQELMDIAVANYVPPTNLKGQVLLSQLLTMVREFMKLRGC